MSKGLKEVDTSDKILGAFIRVLCLVIAALCILHLTAWRQPCDIDKQFFNCRVTGSWGDFIGIPIWIAGMVALSGIHKGFNNIVQPPNATPVNFAVFGGMVLGALLFWFA